MIDLNEIESEVGAGNIDEILMFTRGEMLELLTRLRQAERDAARYRFIKEWNQSYSLNVYRKELWNEVVDKAMWMESQCNKARD